MSCGQFQTGGNCGHLQNLEALLLGCAVRALVVVRVVGDGARMERDTYNIHLHASLFRHGHHEFHVMGRITDHEPRCEVTC